MDESSQKDWIKKCEKCNSHWWECPSCKVKYKDNKEIEIRGDMLVYYECPSCGEKSKSVLKH